MDDLLDYLRNEIAMDGDDGTPVDRLDTFLQTYYARDVDPNNTSSTSTQISSQNLDASFREFVWRQLIALPEVKVAYLRKAVPALPAPPPAEDGASGGTPQLDDNSPVPAPTIGEESENKPTIDQGTYNLKNKQKIKAARKDGGKKARDARIAGAEQDAWEFCELNLEEAQGSSRLELSEKYGSDKLRVAADPETCFVALTGSHERQSRLTYLSYQILQAITRGREDGKTVVDLGKEFDHDQKSLFHFVKSLLEMNLIVKIKVMAGRTMTSRCIHRHYLETSEHWAAWQTKDTGGNDALDNNNADEDDNDYGLPAELSILTVAHLNSNEPLIRARIIAALKREKDHIIPHVEIVFKIGFLARPPRMQRRRLNRIITSMAQSGVIEKIGVRLPGARGELSCIRLVEQSESAIEAGEANRISSGEEQQDEEEQRPNLLLTIPIERQMIDLLVEAGAKGLTIRELKSALGDLNNRILETLLSRFERSPNPPHLCDFTLHSVLETFGREKRLRWFTLAGYHERCRLDGLADLPDMKSFSNPEQAGEFGVLDTLGFYENGAAFRDYAEGWNTSAAAKKAAAKKRAAPKGPKGTTGVGPGSGGKRAAGAGTSKARGPAAEGEPKVHIGRPRGSTKAAKLEKMLADGKVTQEEYEELLKKVPKPRTILDKIAANGEVIPKPPSVPRTKAAKLEKAFKDGEITQAEYEEQKAKMPKARKTKEAAASPQVESEGTPAAAATAEGITPAPEAENAKPHPNSKAGKLEKAFAEGQVTQEEYEEQKKALPKPRPKKRKAADTIDGNGEGSPAPSAKFTAAEGESVTNPAKKAKLSREGTSNAANADTPAEEAEISMQEVGDDQTAESGNKGKKRKRVSEPKVGPDGEPLPPKVNGRPRKYPVGLSKEERKRLREERIAAGIDPPPKTERGRRLLEKQTAGTAGGEGEVDELAEEDSLVAEEGGGAVEDTPGSVEPDDGASAKEEGTPQRKRPRRRAAITGADAAAESLATTLSQIAADHEQMRESVREPPSARRGVPDTVMKVNQPLPRDEESSPVKAQRLPTTSSQITADREEFQAPMRRAVSAPPEYGPSIDVHIDQPLRPLDEVKPAEKASAEPVVPKETSKRGRGRPKKRARKSKQAADGKDNSKEPSQDPEESVMAEIDEGVGIIEAGDKPEEFAAAEVEEGAGINEVEDKQDKTPAAEAMSVEAPPASVVDDVTQAVLNMLDSEPKEAEPEQQYSASPFGPKRPRGRPRKHARSGPEPMKPFKYGVYPNFNIYPPIKEPVQVEERKTRAQLRDERNRRSSTIETESRQTSPLSIRDQLRLATQRSTSESRQLSPSQPPHSHLQPLSSTSAEVPIAGRQAMPEAAAQGQSVAGPSTSPSHLRSLVLPEMPAPLPTDESESMQLDFELPPMPLPSLAVDDSMSESALAVSRPRQQFTDITILPSLPVADKKTNAGKANERRNYSMHLHENEYAAALKEAGGIVAEGMPFHRIWQEYLQAKNRLDALPRMLDRRTTVTVMNGLQTRGMVKRSVLQMQGRTGKLVQTPVFYLPDIDLNGREMREFVQNLQETPLDLTQGKNWLQGRKTIDKSGESRQQGQKIRSKAKVFGKTPQEARAFFGDEWRIVAQRYGWQFGLIARARTLHEHLAESINDDNDSAFILSSRPDARIFATGYVLKDIPLSVFMCIAATNGNTELLDEFLASHDPTQVLMNQVPRALHDLFPVAGSKVIGRFSQLFDVLSALQVIIPLEQVEQPTDIVAYSGASMEPRYFRARAAKGSNYWMLANASPLYDLSQKRSDGRRLVGEFLTRNLEEIKQYWETIEAIAFGRIDTAQLPEATGTYRPVMISSTAVTESVRMPSRWRRSYLLLKTQKLYIKRIIDEQQDVEAFTQDEEAIGQLAYNIWAPISVLRPYVEGQVKKKSAKAETSRRANRGRGRKERDFVVSDEDDASDSSEFDEEAAVPVARPKRRRARPARTKAAAQVDTQEDATEMRVSSSAEGEDASTHPPEQPETVNDILARKAKDVMADREKTWDGIYRAFVAEHGKDALGDDQIDFLKSWFLSPGGINAKDLLEHLQTMVADTAMTLPTPKAVLGISARVSNANQQMRVSVPKRKRAKQVVIPQDTNPDAADTWANNVEIPEVSFVIPPDGPNKTAAGGWTDAEDEQLRDFYVIIQARASSIGYKFNTDPLKHFYPEIGTKTLLDRLRRFATVNEETPYLDALQDAWTKVWIAARKRGELPDPDPASWTKFDLGKERNYLCARVNKQSIRFQSMTPMGAASAKVNLPMDPSGIYTDAVVTVTRPLNEKDDAHAWDYLYSAITAAQKTKEYRLHSFAVPNSSFTAEKEMDSADRVALFAERLPYRARLSEQTRSEAASFVKQLITDGETEWQNVAEDGAMLAVAHLFSDNLLDFNIDTSSTLEGRPYTDYRTRKIDDESFENDLSMSLKESYKLLSGPLFA